MDQKETPQVEVMGAAPATTNSTNPPQPLAFADLFEQEFDYVWFTLRRLGVPERDLEDVAHDVFIQVHRRLDEYDPGRPIRPWLFAFAYRLASDYRRLARHRIETLEERADTVDPALSPADHLIAKQTLELSWRALQKLEIDRRAVFLLHEVEGLSIPELSELLHIPVNTAYSRLRLAREQFAKALHRLRARQGET